MQNHQATFSEKNIDAMRDEAIKEALDNMKNDWKLKDETPDYFLLTKTNETLKGQILIALLFGWWLFFIPNLIYHFATKKNKKIYKYSLVRA